MVGPAHSFGEEIDDEVDFYVKHLVGSVLSEKSALELKEQA